VPIRIANTHLRRLRGVAAEAEAEFSVLDPHRAAIDPDLGARPDVADHESALHGIAGNRDRTLGRDLAARG
jgi:hypothetical protein